MSSDAPTTPESPAPCETRCDYYEVFRKIAVSGLAPLRSQMIEVKDANTVEVDAEDLVHTGLYNVGITVEYGNDGESWTSVATSPALTFSATGAKSGVLSDVSAKFVRLRIAGSPGAGSARVSAGIRLRTELPKFIRAVGPLLPGFEAEGRGQDEAYFLLADRLHVARGASVILAPVSMLDRNAVKLEVVVVQPTALPISADVQASNDAQTWETLVSYSGLSFGYNSPNALTGVSHRYVRVKVNGPQAISDAIVELGLALSRQSP